MRTFPVIIPTVPWFLKWVYHSEIGEISVWYFSHFLKGIFSDETGIIDILISILFLLALIFN
mgnify:CR=1 FL=1